MEEESKPPPCPCSNTGVIAVVVAAVVLVVLVCLGLALAVLNASGEWALVAVRSLCASLLPAWLSFLFLAISICAVASIHLRTRLKHCCAQLNCGVSSRWYVRYAFSFWAWSFSFVSASATSHRQRRAMQCMSSGSPTTTSQSKLTSSACNESVGGRNCCFDTEVPSSSPEFCLVRARLQLIGRCCYCQHSII